MARNVARMTDANSGGGVITTIPQSTVFANSLLVSINGSIGTDHGKNQHNAGRWRTANGSSNVFIQGTPVNRQSDADSCSHSRVGGSPTVFVN